MGFTATYGKDVPAKQELLKNLHINIYDFFDQYPESLENEITWLDNDDEAVYYKLIDELAIRPVLVIADADFYKLLDNKSQSYFLVSNNSIINYL